MAQRSIRFPDEIAEKVQAIAEREDRSFSYVVVRALESALGSKGEGVANLRSEPASSRASVERERAMDALEDTEVVSPGVRSRRAPVEKEPEADASNAGSDTPTVRSPAPSRPAGPPSIRETWGR